MEISNLSDAEFKTLVIRMLKELVIMVPACEPKFGCQFDSQSRAHAWAAGQVPSRGHSRGHHTLMFLSLLFSLPFLL